MFDYVQNRYNLSPSLVVGPHIDSNGDAESDEFRYHLRFSTIYCRSVPSDPEALRQVRGRKYWSGQRRYERKMVEAFGPVGFRVLTDEGDLREALPRVQQLYRERWADEYTSLPWKSDEGFAPYADAMVDLASTGEAELAVLETRDTLLSFGYSLIKDGTYHFYQHATILDPAYRAFGPGSQLLAKLLAHVTEAGHCHTIDFMLGEAGYKSEWATYTLPVYLRVRAERSVMGAVRFGTSVALQRAKIFAQFNPALRPVGKWAMLALKQ